MLLLYNRCITNDDYYYCKYHNQCRLMDYRKLEAIKIKHYTEDLI